MTCPKCGGPMSCPMLSRRTGLWNSTCRACGHFAQSATPPSRPAPESTHGAMFAPEPTRPSSTPMTPIGAVATSMKARRRQQRELEDLNKTDGRLKAAGDDR